MHYPTYCGKCQAVTGHQSKYLTTSCIKCGTVKKTPLLRWIALVVLLGSITLLMLWIMYSSIVLLLHGL